MNRGPVASGSRGLLRAGWFAGGWVEPFDSQETALRSAMTVAAGLGATGARLQALQRR